MIIEDKHQLSVLSQGLELQGSMRGYYTRMQKTITTSPIFIQRVRAPQIKNDNTSYHEFFSYTSRYKL